MGLAHQVWSPHVILFFLFSFSLSVLLSGWLLGAQGLSEFTFFPGLLRPDWEGALHLHQGGGVLRPHPTERAPAASVNRASSVPGALLAFCVNQGRSSLFLSPFFTFLIADAVILRIPLDPAVAGPQQIAISYFSRSSQPRDWTHISCVSYTGRWILYYCHLGSLFYTW